MNLGVNRFSFVLHVNITFENFSASNEASFSQKHRAKALVLRREANVAF